MNERKATRFDRFQEVQRLEGRAVLLSGKFVDKVGRNYFLTLEPALDNGDNTYLISREFTTTVWVPRN